MRAIAGLTLLLVNVHSSLSCSGEGSVLFCRAIPSAFPPGYSSLVMFLENVGEINSTMFRSDGLASVTRLRMENSGVTGIAEGAFGSFQNLTHLFLNQNLLTEINPNWFGRPDILSELRLSENHIEVLDETMLSGLINLTSLSLNKNGIRTIDPNSFSSLTVLAELDLSENRMTHLSPEVFRSLRSTSIRLDGNPWDCSCGAEDFVDLLKDLKSRSQLDRPAEVTCEGPPPLRGQPVWNVSVCVTPPPPRPPSVTGTHPYPTGTLSTVPSSTVVTKRPSWPTSETRTSLQPKSTDAPSSSHTATAPAWPTSGTRTSVQPKPTDNLTTTTKPALQTETHVTSPPSMVETSDLHTYTVSTPTDLTETCSTSRPGKSNIVCILVVVIAVLSLLLFVASFLALLRRRKRNNKTVMPGCPTEDGNETKEEDGSSRLRDAQPPGRSEKSENNHRDSEMGWRRPFTGVRAKSADAILFTSPFCAPMKDQVTLQTETETQSKDTEHRAEGKQELGSETVGDGEFETENLKNTTDVNGKRAAEGRNPDKDPHGVPVNTEAVPYLSIGTSQNNPDDVDKQTTDDPRQRSHKRKFMGRISTWPPTAAHWQARCKMMEKEEEEEGPHVFTVWSPKLPGEIKKVLNIGEHHFSEDKIERNQTEDPLKINVAQMKVAHSQASEPKDKTTKISKGHVHTDMKQEELLKKEIIPDPVNREKLCKTQGLKPAEENTKRSSNSTEPRRAVTGRQRAENRSTGSKAPSGGATPDDETLLTGNEYAFMDLLHEVSQNNGRWTRERWRQAHVNKQRR